MQMRLSRPIARTDEVDQPALLVDAGDVFDHPLATGQLLDQSAILAIEVGVLKATALGSESAPPGCRRETPALAQDRSRSRRQEPAKLAPRSLLRLAKSHRARRRRDAHARWAGRRMDSGDPPARLHQR